MPTRLSYANVTATLALFFAMSGGALAARHYLISKTSQISPSVLKAIQNDSTPDTTTFKALIPSAHVAFANTAGSAASAATAGSATSAANATNATNATTAGNANTLGGQPPSSYLTTANRIGTNGVVKEAAAEPPGNNVTLFTVGPFTVTMNCTKSGSTTSNTIKASSTEANSIAFGTLMPTANTPTDVGPDASSTTFAINDNVAVDLEAPSGAGFGLDAADGVNSLGTDCWANWSGVR